MRESSGPLPETEHGGRASLRASLPAALGAPAALLRQGGRERAAARSGGAANASRRPGARSHGARAALVPGQGLTFELERRDARPVTWRAAQASAFPRLLRLHELHIRACRDQVDDRCRGMRDSRRRH